MDMGLVEDEVQAQGHRVRDAQSNSEFFLGINCTEFMQLPSIFFVTVVLRPG